MSAPVGVVVAEASAATGSASHLALVATRFLIPPMIDRTPAELAWNGRFPQSLPDEGQSPIERIEIHVGVRLFDSAPSKIDR